MSFAEAIATQPQWVQIWLNIMGPVVMILPLVLLIWRETRVGAALLWIGTVLAAVSIMWMYQMMGYTRLLGLPHLFVWIPGVAFLLGCLRSGSLSIFAKIVATVLLMVITTSLIFDITDVVRYILGERSNLVP